MSSPYHDGEPGGGRRRSTAAAGLLARYILLLLSCAACALATGAFIMAVKWLIALI